MVTFKTIARKKNSYGFYRVYIRVTHNRKVLYMKTDKLAQEKDVGKGGEVNDAFVLNYCTNKICEFQNDNNAVVVKSAGNIPGVKTASVNTLNVYDVLNCDKFIICQDAAKKIEEVYA